MFVSVVFVFVIVVFVVVVVVDDVVVVVVVVVVFVRRSETPSEACENSNFVASAACHPRCLR